MKVIQNWEAALGPQHPDVGAAWNNLGSAYYGEGRFGEAEASFLRAWRICETSLGPEHPCATTALINLASTNREQRRYDDAEAYYQRTLAIQARTLGPRHPQMFQTLANMAELYRNEQRYGAAAELYERALEIAEVSVALPELRSVLSSYVFVLRKLHRKEKARTLEAGSRA